MKTIDLKKMERMEKEILKYLKKEKLINKDNSVDYYYDYREEVEVNEYDLLDFKSFEDFESQIIEEINDNNFEVLENEKNYILGKILENFNNEELIKIFDLQDLEDLKDYLTQFLEENIFIDFRKNLPLSDAEFQIHLTSEKYLEDAWHNLEFIKNNIEEILKSDKTTLKDVRNIFEEEKAKNNPLNILINSQGYKFEDLFNEKIRKESIFLNSLYEELYSYINDLSGCFLTFCGKTDVKDYFTVVNSKSKSVVFSKSTTLGLYNPVWGSGAGLNIELEKDAVIPRELLIFGNRKESYKIDDVFGFYLKNTTLKNTNLKTKAQKIDFKNLKQIFEELKNN